MSCPVDESINHVADELLRQLDIKRHGSNQDECDFCTADYRHIRKNPNTLVKVKGREYSACWSCERVARNISKRRNPFDNPFAVYLCDFQDYFDLFFTDEDLAEWLVSRMKSREYQEKKRNKRQAA